jgi:hypothetical protein
LTELPKVNEPVDGKTVAGVTTPVRSAARAVNGFQVDPGG